MRAARSEISSRSEGSFPDVTSDGAGDLRPGAGGPPRRVPELTTTRLHLRAPTLDDAADLFERYTQDPIVTRNLTWTPHDSIESTRTFLRRCLAGIAHGSVLPWVMTEREDDRGIGMVELRPTGHRAELGYVLARAWWGRRGQPRLGPGAGEGRHAA